MGSVIFLSRSELAGSFITWCVSCFAGLFASLAFQFVDINPVGDTVSPHVRSIHEIHIVWVMPSSLFAGKWSNLKCAQTLFFPLLYSSRSYLNMCMRHTVNKLCCACIQESKWIRIESLAKKQTQEGYANPTGPCLTMLVQNQVLLAMRRPLPVC